MQPRTRTAYSAGLVLGSIVVMLGLAVAGITWWLRAGLRDQILRREGESLYAVTVMLQTLEDDRPRAAEPADDEERLLILALQASRLRGVLGVEIFDGLGRSLHKIPTTLQLPNPSAGEWATLRALQPVTSFQPTASLGGLYGLGDDPQDQTPLLEIVVPLHRTGATTVDGVASFVLEGQLIAGEFRLLDLGLAKQAGLVWLLATGVSVAGVGWMLARLTRANLSLLARTEDLVRANRELGLAAKTSALGAVTAHLVHGLRNPIAGLEAFIEEQRNDESPTQNGAWSEATATARRMRAMVSEVVSLMQEEQSATVYELSGREVLATVSTRIAAEAAKKQMAVAIVADDAARLTNHQAGLVTAILTNLAQNACDALSASGGRLALKLQLLPDGALEFAVEDNGPGLSEDIRASLFAPRPSPKPGGAGIGLAISRQLALHLGGTLDLVTTGPAGTSFRLLIPSVKPQ